MKRFRHLSLAVFLVISAPGIAAQEDAGQSERCVSLTSIKRMTILDNRHIIFDLTGGRHYLNTLPYPCAGLHRSRAIMYRTSLSRLCDLDIITVLDDVGPGFRPMGSCGLGVFQPVTDEELGNLKTEIRLKREQPSR